MSKWIEVVELNKIPVLGSRLIKTRDTDIAVFRGSDDQVYAFVMLARTKAGRYRRGLCTARPSLAPCTTGKLTLPAAMHLRRIMGVAMCLR